jgi:hypothetical protein
MRNFRFTPFVLVLVMAGLPRLGMGKMLKQPVPYDLETLYKQMKTDCPTKDWGCFERQITAVTMTNGPKAAVDVFTLLQTRGDVDPSIDAHHVVHHIGHHTAMAFGNTAEAFSMCPPNYNYGCLHGFFQQALGSGGSTEKVAAKICEEVEGQSGVLSKTKFSCYHGLGHGIMMYEDHDLNKSLKVCDSLKSPMGADGCWQGVFMENVDVAEMGQWQKGQFSKEDPLAPCDKMEPKHQHECFINHSGWLMVFFGNDINKAAQACLKAPAGQVNTCLQTLGLLTTNGSWQRSLLPGWDSSKFVQNAWTLCQKYPQGYVDQCVVAALDNILNSNVVNDSSIHTAQDFCQTVDDTYQPACFRQMGADLRYLTADMAAASAGCAHLKKKARTACETGVGPA